MFVCPYTMRLACFVGSRKLPLVSFSDPFVRRAPSEHANDFVTDQSLPLDAETLRAHDVCVLVTNHMEFDYELVVETAARLVDTRGCLSQ